MVLPLHICKRSAKMDHHPKETIPQLKGLLPVAPQLLSEVAPKEGPLQMALTAELVCDEERGISVHNLKLSWGNIQTQQALCVSIPR